MQKNAIADRFHIILASKSPRRRQLLRDAGFEFTLADSFEVEEIYPETLAAEEVAEFLSNLKADAYPVALKGNDVLITSDTVVVADGEVMGKPADYDDAFRMLSKLSGRMHSHGIAKAILLRRVRCLFRRAIGRGDRLLPAPLQALR